MLARSNKPRRSRRRAVKRYANLPERAPSSQQMPNLISQPRLAPTVAVARTVEGLYDVTTDGVNPTLVGFNFSLSDVPGFSEMTALFQTYCIEKIQLWWRPEYTVLSDASALSNSQNVEFNSAIDLTSSTAPSSVNSLLEYQSVAHTSIVQTHFRTLRPAYSMDGVAPTCARLSVAVPSTDWNGIKIGINPTGIAMTFRSVAKFYISLSGLK